MSDEVWRDIEGLDGHYQVSNQGRVRRTDKAPLCNSSKPWKIVGDGKPCSSTGYMRVSLRKNCRCIRFQVHRLVAKAFLPDHPPGTVVNHKDGNKANNHVENLEYLTHRENVLHSWRAGLCKATKGEKNGNHILTEAMVRVVLDALVRGVRPADIAMVFGVTPQAIDSIKYGNSWKHLTKESHVA